MTPSILGHCRNGCGISVRGICRSRPSGKHNPSHSCPSTRSVDRGGEEATPAKVVRDFTSVLSTCWQLYALQSPQRNSIASYSNGWSCSTILRASPWPGSQNYSTKWNQRSICELSYLFLGSRFAGDRLLRHHILLLYLLSILIYYFIRFPYFKSVRKLWIINFESWHATYSSALYCLFKPHIAFANLFYRGFRGSCYSM